MAQNSGAKPKPGAQPDLGFNYDGAAEPRLTSGGKAGWTVHERLFGKAGWTVHERLFGKAGWTVHERLFGKAGWSVHERLFGKASSTFRLD
jgi:hypothetical protein